MWDSLLNFLVKTSSLQPEYTRERCLAYKQSSAACHACKDACPHEAISFKRGKEVLIDDIDCTGCGLCVSVCPSEALAAKVAYQPGAPLKCSQVKGSAQTVQCLTRLEPTDLLKLAGTREHATLVRNACEGCKVGGAATPRVLEATAARAQALAESLGRPFRLEVQVAARYDATDNPAALSRRDLLRGGWRGVQQTAADVLAPLDPGGDDSGELPAEMQRQYRLLADLPDDTEVPWPLPRVAEGCILCPVCTNVCPTKAFSRDFNPEDRDGAALVLEPERCLGCDACAKACPVKVITLEPTVMVAELTGGPQEAYFRPAGEKLPGGVSR
jgi:ferredoxin